MTRKVYRTAQGKNVDLGALILQNENVRAVGNMKVNARGDLIDSENRPIDTRNQQVSRQYNRQTTNVHEDTVYTSATQAAAHSHKKSNAPAASVKPVQPPVVPAAPEDFDDDFVREVLPPIQPVAKSTPKPQPDPTAESVPAGGLAAAIAKARQIKQEPLKTPRQIAQEKQGVKKL